MPALPQQELYAVLRAALPAGSILHGNGEDTHPVTATVPGVGQVCVYLWTVTQGNSAEGARPADEFKIQLILPDQERGS